MDHCCSAMAITGSADRGSTRSRRATRQRCSRLPRCLPSSTTKHWWFRWLFTVLQPWLESAGRWSTHIGFPMCSWGRCWATFAGVMLWQAIALRPPLLPVARPRGEFSGACPRSLQINPLALASRSPYIRLFVKRAGRPQLHNVHHISRGAPFRLRADNFHEGDT